MGEPIRVLQVVTHMNRGGLETMLMNYYRNIDRNKVQFDFLTHRPENEKKDYDDEIRSLGGKIYHMPVLNPFSPSYMKSLDQFFKDCTFSLRLFECISTKSSEEKWGASKNCPCTYDTS